MPDNDTLKGAAAFLAFVLAGLWAYFRPQRPPPANPTLTTIGMELGNRDQTERLISEVRRIGDVLENKRHAADTKDAMFKDIMDRLDRREEQEESSRRPDPQRQRRR